MILRYDESTFGIRGSYKNQIVSKTVVYVRCDNCNNKEWKTTWTYRKNRNHDYCESCKNVLGIHGMKGKKHSAKTLELFKDGRRAGDNNPSKRQDVRAKISNSLKGKPCWWLKGTKRPNHSSLMKIKMKEVWKNYSDDMRAKQINHLMRIGRPGRISKLHLNFKKELCKNNILGFKSEVHIKSLNISVDELNTKTNTIIEIFGDYWHANPEIYESFNTFNFNNTIITASDIWKKDKLRISKLENLGYTVIVIWEKDIRENLNTVIQNIKNII